MIPMMHPHHPDLPLSMSCSTVGPARAVVVTTGGGNPHQGAVANPHQGAVASFVDLCTLRVHVRPNK